MANSNLFVFDTENYLYILYSIIDYSGTEGEKEYDVFRFDPIEKKYLFSACGVSDGERLYSFLDENFIEADVFCEESFYRFLDNRELLWSEINGAVAYTPGDAIPERLHTDMTPVGIQRPMDDAVSEEDFDGIYLPVLTALRDIEDEFIVLDYGDLFMQVCKSSDEDNTYYVEFGFQFIDTSYRLMSDEQTAEGDMIRIFREFLCRGILPEYRKSEGWVNNAEKYIQPSKTGPDKKRIEEILTELNILRCVDPEDKYVFETDDIFNYIRCTDEPEKTIDKFIEHIFSDRDCPKIRLCEMLTNMIENG